MGEINPEALTKTLLVCEHIEENWLKASLVRINEKFTKAKKKAQADNACEDSINFESLIEDTLEYYELYNLFDKKPYKKAIGTYYNLVQAIRKREAAEQAKLIGKVLEVTPLSVWIRASLEVEIRFQTTEPHRVLKMGDLDTGVERKILSGCSRYVSDTEYHKAKVTALAALNSRRK